jgi:glutathione S-transferase
MILIGQYDSPFVRRVAVTLNLYNIAFERNPLSVFGDFEYMKRINPLRRVPALVLDDGETLIDSDAIIDHLDEVVGPKRALMPSEGAERREILKLVQVARGISDKTVQLSMEQMFHDEAQRSSTLMARCTDQISQSLAFLEQAVTDHWFMGDKLTHADVMSGCTLGHLHLRQPQLFAEDAYPKLHELSARCELNKGFAASRIGANETVPSKL